MTKDGFQNNDFRTVDDGITIELTPWITKHGEVNVTIAPSIKTAEQVVGGTPAPVTNRSINTNVSLMDGETIALGGLINSTESNSREFVPILGSIPVLGYLFSWRKAHTFTTELVIYVTPHILNPETQAVNLEEEFEALDRRSGFLKRSDFLKSSKQAAARKDSLREDSKSTAPPVAAPAAPAPAPIAPAQPIAPAAKPANPSPSATPPRTRRPAPLPGPGSAYPPPATDTLKAK